MRSSKRGGMPSIFLATFSLGSLIRRHSVGTQLSAMSGLGCPSRFASGLRSYPSSRVTARRVKLAGPGLSRWLDWIPPLRKPGLAIESFA